MKSFLVDKKYLVSICCIIQNKFYEYEFSNKNMYIIKNKNDRYLFYYGFRLMFILKFFFYKFVMLNIIAVYIKQMLVGRGKKLDTIIYRRNKFN